MLFNVPSLGYVYQVMDIGVTKQGEHRLRILPHSDQNDSKYV